MEVIMIKGLVLFDYDGTLVDERDQIYVPTSKTKKAISTLQDLGYLCVLATGRALSYIPKGAKDLYLDGYITSNGANVTIHGKEIAQDVIGDEELLKIIKVSEETNVNFILEGNTFCYVKDLKDKNYLRFMDNFKLPEDNFVAYKNFEQVSQNITKITFVFENAEKLKTMKEYLEKTYSISIHHNGETFDIAKRSIHKGVGVKAIVAYYKVPMEETYAFGEGDNDVELLGSVKHAIAMKTHDKKLDAVATLVTDEVREEGIYNALRKMGVL
ncbi:MAG: Cof-type HAD-IIB family hydrolase, partial [Longicatena sp.]